jgi:hypothetical protein
LASDRERYTHTIDPESATETNLSESISFSPSQKICTQSLSSAHGAPPPAVLVPVRTKPAPIAQLRDRSSIGPQPRTGSDGGRRRERLRERLRQLLCWESYFSQESSGGGVPELDMNRRHGASGHRFVREFGFNPQRTRES